MKFIRYGELGKEKPGVIDAEGNIRDLSGLFPDITAVEIMQGSQVGTCNIVPENLPLVNGQPRLGVPYSGIQKIIGVGLNYSDHAAESNMAIPSEPILFSKAITSINGPQDNIVIPRDAKKVDWEVELGVVMGRQAKNVSEEEALSHVAGYCVVNDVSERELQIERSSGQWFKGKGLDTFCPIGPYLVSRDEVPDPQTLSLWLEVNGVRRQTGNTATMIFSVAYLIHYISRFITLMPGDLIATGTPPGVGMGMSPPQYLHHGDLIELGIEGLGQQHQKTVVVA